MKTALIITWSIIILNFIIKCLIRHSERKQRHIKKTNRIPVEIVYNIDTKNKTLQEYQAERKLMRKMLIENF